MIKIKNDTIIFLLFLFSIGILVYSSLTFQVDNVVIDNEIVDDFNDEWNYFNKQKEKTTITLPQNIHTEPNQVVVITKQLSDEWEGLTITFRTTDQLVKVFFNNTATYSFGYNNERTFGKTPGSAWHFVRIPRDIHNGEIRIELSSPYQYYGGNLPSMYIGTKSACLFRLVVHNVPAFIICFIIFLFGVTNIILYFLIPKLNIHTKSLLYLGQFAVIMSLASMIETRLFQLFFGNQTFFSISIFLLYMLAPISVFMYMGETYFYSMQKKYHKIVKLFIINFILTVSLQIMNIFDFMETNWITHTLIILVCIYSYIDLCKLLVKNKWNSRLIHFFMALSLLVLCVFLDIFNFYVLKKGDVAIFQRIGLFIFILTLSIMDIRKFLSLLKQGMEANALRQIAYEDILTKCKNRLYFEDRFIDIGKNLSNYNDIVIAIFDVNNLKLVNDFKGHLEGDSILVHSAALINECFSEYSKISRIGGDEFAFIATEVPHKQIERSILRFCEAMKNQNDNLDIDFDIAYGYVYYDPSIDKNLQATFDRADSKMYKCKNEMKRMKNLG